MTTINVVRQAHAVHLITDAAGYDQDGRILFIQPKAWALPHLNMAVAGRGPKLLPPLFADLIAGMADGYDQVKEGVVELVRRFFDEQREFWRLHAHGSDFDFIVAGISERDGPDSYYFGNHDRHGFEPWTLVQLGDVAMTPFNKPILDELHSIFPPGTRAGDLDAERDGLRMVEIQRRHAIPSGPRSIVMTGTAGFVQITSVRAGSITTKVLHRWPDKIGDSLEAA